MTYLVVLLQDAIIASSSENWDNMSSEEIEEFISKLDNASEVVGYQVMKTVFMNVR